MLNETKELLFVGYYYMSRTMKSTLFVLFLLILSKPPWERRSQAMRGQGGRQGAREVSCTRPQAEPRWDLTSISFLGLLSPQQTLHRYVLLQQRPKLQTIFKSRFIVINFIHLLELIILFKNLSNRNLASVCFKEHIKVICNEHIVYMSMDEVLENSLFS